MLSKHNAIQLFDVKNSGIFFFLASIAYFLVAYKSSGYHHEDEHYQIVEFANFKLGMVPIDRLAWEFNAEIRPGLHPLLCFIFFKFLMGLGVTDGYDLAFSLRLLTAALSLFVIRAFVSAHLQLIERPLRRWFIFFSYFLWFLPYINVRFSSETWSGLFVLMSLTFIKNRFQKEKLHNFFILGIILGSAILFRYQTGLIVFGMFLWFIFVYKVKIKHLTILMVSVCFTLSFGLLIDLWLYGHFTLSIYNYFIINLVDGVSSTFGTSPWYQIILYIIKSPGPIGILMFISFFVVLFYNHKNILIWCTLPFLLAHILIPHKELRFLFPIANLTPLFLVLSFQLIRHKISFLGTSSKTTMPLKIVLALLILIPNVAGVIAVSTTGAGSNRTSVTQFIHRHYDESKINIVVINDQNPYMDWGPPINSFYGSKNISLEHVQNIWKPDFLGMRKAGYKNLFIIASGDITGPRALRLFDTYGFRKVYENIPGVTKLIYSWYNPDFNYDCLNVYEF